MQAGKMIKDSGLINPGIGWLIAGMIDRDTYSTIRAGAYSPVFGMMYYPTRIAIGKTLYRMRRDYESG